MAPAKSATGMAIQPPDPSVPPKNKKQKQNAIAVRDTVPSIDKSIEPIMIINVTPIVTIKNGDAAIAILAKLRREKKLGFRNVKNTTSTTKTIIGITD